MTNAIFQEGESNSSVARKRNIQKKGKIAKNERPEDAQVFPGQPKAPPTDAPSFSLDQIRQAVPKHCFERSLMRSLGHLFLDLVKAGALFYFATFISHPLVPTWARYILWPAYWYTQGVVLTGVWVLAHECGHGAFSDYKFVNDLVGMVCHSALLVPYHSWRISHGNHHKNTCSMEHDEVFVAASRSELGTDMINDTPLVNLFWVFNMLTFGWPGYLIANFSGPNKYKGKKRSHFEPDAALFKKSQFNVVLLSDFGLFVAIALIAYAISQYGWANVTFYYFLPYLVVNAHLVLITFLQHTDTYIPHFRESEFTWLRGALATVDRSLGPVIDDTIHHIADTHVCHHLFHYLPFYHAQEATEAIKKVIGPYYLKDDTPIAKALFRAWSKCRFVEDDAGVVFYKDANALAPKQ